jgi:hypothetical protein
MTHRNLGGMAGGVALALLLATTSAQAALIADGITYTLSETDGPNALTDRFTLVITGINGAADTKKGRSGVNAIALTKPVDFTTAAMVTPPTGFNFVVGGLNSTGCNGSGNFYCFDNTSIPPTPTTAFPADDTLTFVFDVTTAKGEFAGYTPDFKIDWVGSKNNYDLVSLPLAIDPPTTVPEPATLGLLGSMLLMGSVAIRRRRNR